MDITLKNISFAYKDIDVLKNITLSIRSKEHVGIIGISGSGKSTLFKLISGLYEVQSGTILIGDAKTAYERRKQIAMITQNAMLLPASIRDNITCGHKMEDKTIYHACKTAQLTDWINTLPAGLDTFVGEQGKQISGGQAQRISIARAIAKNTPIILLDEPTSALDDSTEHALIAALKELTQHKTVLHISHKPETLDGYSRILRLERGQLYDT